MGEEQKANGEGQQPDNNAGKTDATPVPGKDGNDQPGGKPPAPINEQTTTSEVAKSKPPKVRKKWSRDNKIQTWMAAFNGLIFILTLVSLYYTRKALYVTNDTLELTRETQKQFYIENEPFFQISILNLPQPPFDDTITFHAEVTNLGKYPASPGATTVCFPILQLVGACAITMGAKWLTSPTHVLHVFPANFLVGKEGHEFLQVFKIS